MTEQEKRIKLAEAMGWKCTSKTTYPDGEVHKSFWRDPETGTGMNAVCDLPDPFTDANDDYAVLEWMREKYGDHDWPSKMKPEWARFSSDVMAGAWYRIGDYARAALKVIDNEN